MMRQMWRVGLASVALMVMTGCAGRVPNQAGLAASPAAVTPSYTTPGYSNTPSYGDTYGSTPNYSSPYGSDPYGSSYGNSYGNTTPGYGSTTGMTNQQLVATVDSVKNGVFLGIGKFKVTVKVTNPANVPLSGTLKVSIMSSGKSIKDFNELVNVPAGQTITRSYEDPRAKADNATVSVIPAAGADPYAAYGTGAQSGYNSMGATGPYGMY
jgi:hypothetical protein